MEKIKDSDKWEEEGRLKREKHGSRMEGWRDGRMEVLKRAVVSDPEKSFFSAS
jgi:hypothetical protein